MLKNITMGQYYPVNSVIHRLDPRVKLLLTLVLIVADLSPGQRPLPHAAQGAETNAPDHHPDLPA